MDRYLQLNGITNWLAYRVPLRIGLFVLLFIIIIFDGFIEKSHSLTGLYILLMILLGLSFSNIYIQIIVSGAASLLRYALSPDGFPVAMDCMIQWFGYFSISFIITTLAKQVVSYKSTISNLVSIIAQIIDAKDEYTANHSRNVAYYASLIGQEMKWSRKQCDLLYMGGMMHDIGKVGIPDCILQKSGRLTDEEYELVKRHPVTGYEILKHSNLVRKYGILDMIQYHHEKYDGTGYPKELQGKDIPLSARIMAVADAFDAMTSARPYRNQQTLEFAMTEIRKGLGTQFDPEIGKVFLTILEREGARILQRNQ